MLLQKLDDNDKELLNKAIIKYATVNPTKKILKGDVVREALVKYIGVDKKCKTKVKN